MIIEWTYGTYAQLQRYFGLGYIDTYSSAYTSYGWVSLDGVGFYSG